LNVLQAVKTILNKLELFDDFPLIKEIVIEKILETKCILIPNSVITHPPIVTLYDLETKMNINDIIINSFFGKVTPKITCGVSFCYEHNIKNKFLFEYFLFDSYYFF